MMVSDKTIANSLQNTYLYSNMMPPFGYNHVSVAILVSLSVISWRFIIRRARAFVHMLETDALKFLLNNDGSMVGELHLLYYDVQL
jgi:hypothetical protein